MHKPKKNITFAPEFKNGAIAQLVEQRTENPCVPGSIPGGTTKKETQTSLFFVYIPRQTIKQRLYRSITSNPLSHTYRLPHPIYTRPGIILLFHLLILYPMSYKAKMSPPDNHINNWNFHSWIIKITIYLIKKLPTKAAVSHIITKFAVYANKMCK